MAANLSNVDLAAFLTGFRPGREWMAEQTAAIHQDLLRVSLDVSEANFTCMHPRDLEFLFGAYDRHIFEDRLQQALQGRPIAFRLAPRMTKAAGKTTTFIRRADGRKSFEIAMAIDMFFDQFKPGDPPVTANGIECRNRLEAFQRVLEHELIHLAEMLAWGDSECAAPRFQEIASRIFGHKAHTHSLLTRKDRAMESGIRVNSRVVFDFEGRPYHGVVNRITKRVTVLVEDPIHGAPYSDGKRYRKFYVPIGALKLSGPA